LTEVAHLAHNVGDMKHPASMFLIPQRQVANGDTLYMETIA
jgi:hypothetical protein